MSSPPRTLEFSVLLQEFFCQYLMRQRDLSPQTVAAYRDMFRILLAFMDRHQRKTPASVQLADLDAPCILAFLNHLESERHNSVRSRNARLAAIRCFLRFAAAREPTCLPMVQRVLAIPIKRYDRPLVGFLPRQEVQAILAAPDITTFSGHRDQVMLAVLYNTGARVSELAALRVQDVTFGSSASIRLHGKGRKERCVPIWKNTARQIKHWLRRVDQRPEAPLLPNAGGTAMTRSGIAKQLAEAVRVASRKLPALAKRRISPHIFRHTTAMHLLESGVDINVIALWLGHESPATTHLYVEADLTMKQRALSKLRELPHKPSRYRPAHKLLHFLETL